MSFKDKFRNFFTVEEEEFDSAPHNYEGQGESPSQAYRQEQPLRSKRSQAIDPRAFQQAEEPARPKVVNIQELQRSSKVVLAEPRVYAEAQDISDHLKSKRAVIVNLQRIHKDQGVRIVDFLSGTVYALGGDIQRIGLDIFLCVPDSVEVSGVISEFMTDDRSY